MATNPITKVALFAIVIVAIAGLVLALFTFGPALKGRLPGIGSVGSTHEHSDFKVYINNVPIDFSQAKYQVRSSYVHVEAGVGDIVHKHATGVTWGFFFQTLGMKFNSTCFVLDTREAFCNDPAANKTLKFFVNGQPNAQFDKYEIRDLDKVLISYGNETEQQIAAQLASITNLSAVESRKV